MHRALIYAFLASVLFAAVAQSQSNSQRNRQDEKRENERVERAQNAIRVEQRELQPLLNELRAAMRLQRQSEQEFQAAQTEIRREREAAEERLEESSGFPELLRQQRELREKFELLSKPILQRVQAGNEWESAKQDADQALIAKEKLLDDEALNEEAFEKRRSTLDAMIRLPQLLETKAIDADEGTKALKSQIDFNVAKLIEMRKKFDDGEVLADPQVKKAIEASKKFQHGVEAASERVATIRSRVFKKQASLARANHELAEAKNADARDRNQSKVSNKKK